MNITYFECVFIVLVTHRKIRIRHIVVFGLFGYTVFFALYHKRHDCWKNLLYTKYVFWFPPQLSPNILILEEMSEIMIIDVYWSSCKIPRYSCRILMKL